MNTILVFDRSDLKDPTMPIKQVQIHHLMRGADLMGSIASAHSVLVTDGVHRKWLKLRMGRSLI